jgi:hypothetical protein
MEVFRCPLANCLEKLTHVRLALEYPLSLGSDLLPYELPLVVGLESFNHYNKLFLGADTVGIWLQLAMCVC